MARFAIFVLLACICCSANCVPLKLKNLCDFVRFKDKGLEVNTFHRISHTFTYQPFGHYFINDSAKCEPDAFKEKVNFMKTLHIKSSVNTIMSRVLTKEFVTTKAHKDFWDFWLKFDYFEKTLEELNLLETGAYSFKIDCLKSCSETIGRGKRFLSDMLPLTFEMFPSDDAGEHKKSDSIKELRRLLEALEINKQTEMFVFAFTPIDEVHEKNLVQRTNLTFSEANTELERRPILHYDIFMPFYKKNYSKWDQPCFYSSYDLPLYFHLPHEKLGPN